MTPRLRAPALALLSIIPLAGCIHSYEKVKNDSERTKVSFESEKAGKQFYEVLSNVPSGKQSTESKTGVHLILINMEKETVTGPNKLFNEAVAYCDTNKDGIITETEAGIFASSLFTAEAR
jgi:hypothetical protein